MRRLIPVLVALLYSACGPTLASAQTTQTTVTSTGDTVTTTVYATAQPVTPAVTIDSILTTVKRAAVKPETVEVVKYLSTPATAPVGVVFGVWHLPPASYASTSYTGAYLGYGTGISASTPAGFLAQVAQAKAAKRRLMVNLVPRKSVSGGGPDMAYYLATVNAWKPFTAQLQAYADSGTIIGFVLADEPGCGSCWGSKAWTNAQMIQVAQATRALLPRIPRGFREDAAKLKARNDTTLWNALDFAWVQYEGPLHVPCASLSIQTCILRQSDAAKSIGLNLVAGVNTLDGGDGSSKIDGTYDLATVKTRWQLSAAEVLKYGVPLVTDPRVCAVLSWRYGGNATKAQINSKMTDQQLADILSFDTRMRATLDSVAKIASQQPVRSCAKSSL